MKISIVIFALCIGYVLTSELTEEQKKKLQPHKDACISQTGIAADAIKELEMTKKYPNDGSLNCYSACMFERFGILTEDGELDEDMVSALMSQNAPEDIVAKAIVNCKSEVTKDDACESAGKLIACFMNNGVKLD